MAKDRLINVGDVVDLTSTNDGIPYRTKIDDYKGRGLFSVGIPSSGGQTMSVHTDDVLFLTFYRETGRYTIQVKVVGFSRRDESRFMTLMQITEPEKDQRRMYFRLPVSLHVVLREYSESFAAARPLRGQIVEAKVIALETAGTKDISVTGVAVLAKNDYEMGKKFILDIYFDEKPREKGKPFVICAEIMRKDFDQRSKSYRLGMHFFGQNNNMSEYLARYVLKQQQKQIKQRRLVEGI
ncbi:MAG: flagellar brake protein [Oscillospiraceae bacterium]|jgi:c-di-GMP-binding flagellar brake protein YcgR|nr:flagellar brake protein [Oscillospiraceae bacterium]